MGTKVHCKTYLPGYHSTRDHNEDANFGWSPFCEDKTFSRQLFSNFKQRGVSSWLDFDKEMLKRTMLEHEAIFQKQLYELHRIYSIQKELMCELKTKQRNRFHEPLETSKSSMYISQLYPEFDEKMWHLRYLQLVSAYQSSENVEGSSDKKASPQVKNFSRRTLDLHLPAEAFIEKEDVEKAQSDNICHPYITTAKTFDIIHGIEANNDVKLHLASVQITGTGKGTLISDLHPRNGLSVHRLADLNEPIGDSIDTGDVNSCSQPWAPIESKISSPQMDLFNDQTSNLDINVEIGQEKQQFSSFSKQSKIFDSSFNSILFKDKFPISSKLLRSNFDKAQESLLPDRMQADIMFQENFAHSNGHNGVQDLVNSEISEFKSSQVASSLLSDISRLSSAAGISVSASSWGKLTKTIDHTPVSVQALQCSNTTTISNGEGTSLYRNSNFHETQKHMNGMDFLDVKHVKDLRLRSAFHRRIQDDATDQQNLFKKHDESSTYLLWLNERSSCNAFASSKECETRLGLGFDKDKSHQAFSELQGEEIMDQGSSICALRHSTLSFDAKQTWLACGGICSVNDDVRSKANFSNSASYSGQSLHNYAKIQGKGMNDINLNSEPTTINDNNLFGTPAGATKRQVPSLPLVENSGKPKCRIDLETPADELEDAEDNTISRIELLNINHPESKVEMSGDKKLSQDICTRLAADAIVTMSKDSHNFSDKTSTFPSSCDSLHLLAEVVALNAESCEAHLDHELDVFESMILELEELKADEYCCKLSQHESLNNKKSMTSLLLRPCRGQARRRRRQRRDFQKDVLPGLALLSRHEVIEDLQALGGTTRTCKTRQTSAQSKGQRRPITITEACYSPAQIHPVHTELENVGKKMMSWGRTTRRCPRQRVPSNR